MERKVLTKDEILAADDIQRQWVDVPEWGGGVYVYVMSGVERDSFEESNWEMRGKSNVLNLQNLRARLCAVCIRDEKGKRLFASKEIKALGKKSGVALSRVFKVAQEINGMTPEDIEEMTKNLKGGQNDSFGSDLPPDSE